MRALLIAVCLSMQLLGIALSLSCNDDARSPPGRVREINPYHGYPGSLYHAAGQALLPVLKFRAATDSTECDAAIRELTRVACTGAKPEVRAIIESAPTESLYPMSKLSQCKTVRCGGCYTGPDSYELGSAFSAMPEITPPDIDVLRPE